MKDRFDVSGKVALVTGASSGLGEHFARTLAQAGAKVVLAARRMDRLEALASEIEAAGGEALAVAMDVTKADTIEAALAATIERFGGPADIIVNNSGMSREGYFTQMSEEDFDLVMDTNLKGVWLVARTFARALAEAGKPGSLIDHGASPVQDLVGLQCFKSGGGSHDTHHGAGNGPLWRAGECDCAGLFLNRDQCR